MSYYIILQYNDGSIVRRETRSWLVAMSTLLFSKAQDSRIIRIMLDE